MGGAVVATIGTVDPSVLLSPIAKRAGLLTSMALVVNGTKVIAEGIWSLPGGLTIKVEAAVLNATGTPNRIGSGNVDRVSIQADGAELQFATSQANKMPTEEERILGVHLDTAWLRFDKAKCVGLLPEIWGLRKKSDLAKRMMEGPVTELSAISEA